MTKASGQFGEDMASGQNGLSPPRPRGKYKLRGQGLSALPNTDLVPAPKPKATAKPRIIGPEAARSAPAKTGSKLAIVACLAVAALSGAAYLVLSSRSGSDATVAEAPVAVTPVTAGSVAPVAPVAAGAVPPAQGSSVPVPSASVSSAPVEAVPVKPVPVEAVTQTAPVSAIAVTADPADRAAPAVGTAMPALLPPQPSSADTVLPGAAVATPPPATAPDLQGGMDGMPAAFSCADCNIPHPALAGLLVKAYHPSGKAGDTMAARLREIGVGEVSVATAGVVPASNQVRYFLPADRAAAQTLADHFGAIVVDLTWYAPAPPAAQVELWITE